jgi:hypothetical protein
VERQNEDTEEKDEKIDLLGNLNVKDVEYVEVLLSYRPLVRVYILYFRENWYKFLLVRIDYHLPF